MICQAWLSWKLLFIYYFRNQLRGVLEIFKAKESLLTSQEVSSSDPYQQLEQTGTQYTYTHIDLSIKIDKQILLN